LRNLSSAESNEFVITVIPGDVNVQNYPMEKTVTREFDALVININNSVNPPFLTANGINNNQAPTTGTMFDWFDIDVDNKSVLIFNLIGANFVTTSQITTQSVTGFLNINIQSESVTQFTNTFPWYWGIPITGVRDFDISLDILKPDKRMIVSDGMNLPGQLISFFNTNELNITITNKYFIQRARQVWTG
jgi:hypothetical protein